MRRAAVVFLAGVLAASAWLLRTGPPQAVPAARPSRAPASPSARPPSVETPAVPPVVPATARALIRGHVVHGTTPVEGAEVVLGTLDLRRGGLIVSEPDFRRTTSGALGYFEFPEVAPGRYRVSSGLEDLAPGLADAEVGPDDRIVDVRLELLAGLTLDVEVVVGGSPIAGAAVEVWIAVAGTEYGRMGRPLRSALTPDSGKLRFAGIPHEASVSLLVRKEGFAPAEELIGPFLAPLYRRVDLFSGLEIYGSVRDSEGRTIPGALVEATQGGAYTLSARTGSDGMFHIRGLRNGPIRLTASSPGFLRGWVDMAAPKIGCVLPLLRPGSLAGTAPEGAVRVTVACGAQSFVRPLDGTLEFRWTGLPPGPAVVTAQDAAGRELLRLEVRIPEADHLDLGTLPWPK